LFSPFVISVGSVHFGFAVCVLCASDVKGQNQCVMFLSIVLTSSPVAECTKKKKKKKCGVGQFQLDEKSYEPGSSAPDE
jgi:hypothetical protein